MQTPVPVYTDFSQLAELKLKARRGQKAALEEAAGQFEALFLEMMLKQMRQANFGDPIFDDDRTRFYREMYDHQLALHLSRQGSLGIADLLVRQLGGEEPSGKRDALDLQDYRRLTVPTPPPPISRKKAPPPHPEAASLAEPVPGRFTSPQQFVETLLPEARRAAAQIGIDPRLLLAQAALETGWGKKIIHHPDGRSSHNLFNIKAGRSWSGDRVQVDTLEYLDGVAVRKRAAFRAYASYRQSFDDFIDLLRQPRYAEALRQVHDPQRYLQALQQAGYATDPDYAAKILAIYRRQTLAAL